MAARVKRFCCCCSLKSGSVIVGIVYMLLGSLMLVLGTDPLVLSALPEDEVFSVYRYQALQSSIYDWLPCKSGKINKIDMITLSNVVLTVVGTLLVVFSIVLILGSCNESYPALVYWLLMDYCWLAAVLVAHAGAAALAVVSRCSGVAFIVAVAAIPVLSATTYCHVVVDRFAQQVRERRQTHRSNDLATVSASVDRRDWSPCPVRGPGSDGASPAAWQIHTAYFPAVSAGAL